MKPVSVLRALFAVAVPVAAWAQASLPTGANVVAGTATIASTATSMTVTTGSPRTIIDYSGFSVGAGNSVRFDQPTTSSATLNRVISTEGSSILGSVSSNGQIFLVNPNGIFVGPGGSFSGSSVYLSTGNISNADFLAENIRFDPPPTGSTIRIGGTVDATDTVHIDTDRFNFEGTDGHIQSSGPMFIGNSGLPPIPVNPVVINPATPPLVLQQGGTIVISGTGSSGNIVLTGGASNPPGTDITVIPTFPVNVTPLVVTGGSISLASAVTSLRLASATSLTPNPVAAPTANLVATLAPRTAMQPPSIPRGTSGLVDGTVTVRLSLVDPAPISLR